MPEATTFRAEMRQDTSLENAVLLIEAVSKLSLLPLKYTTFVLRMEETRLKTEGI